MRKTELEARLRSLIGEVTGRDASGVPLDGDLLDALRMDSLMALRVLAAVEQRFGMRFPDSSLGHLRSLEDLCDALTREET